MLHLRLLTFSLLCLSLCNLSASQKPQGKSYFHRLEDFAQRRDFLRALKSDPEVKVKLDDLLAKFTEVKSYSTLNRVATGQKQQQQEESNQEDEIDANPSFRAVNNSLQNNPLVTEIGNGGAASGIDVNALLAAFQSSSQCTMDTLRMFTELASGSQWALQMADSMGKPGPAITKGRLNFLGDYDQCMEVVAPPLIMTSGFKGQYVRQTILVMGLLEGFPAVPAQWGVCLPDSCSEEEITSMFNITVYSLGVNGTLLIPGEGSALATGETSATAATYAAVAILILLGMLLILATMYDVTVIQWPRWEAEEKKKLYKESSKPKPASPNEVKVNGDINGQVNGQVNGKVNGQVVGNVFYPTVGDAQTHDNKAFTVEIGDQVKSNGVNGHANGVNAMAASGATTKPPTDENPKISSGVQALLAFSVYTNMVKFLNTHQPASALRCVHGMRFFSMSWVLLGHVFAFGQNYFMNPMDVQELLQRWEFDAVSNALLSVDSFFTLSGLLTAYLTVRAMNKVKSWKINWVLYYFHRFWRLTPPMMLVMVLILGLAQYMGSGPLWDDHQPADKEFCEDNWWTNMLYINNLYKTKEMCFGHGWYLANDMQFYLVSPLMIVPFFFSMAAGITVCSMIFIATTVYTGYNSYDQGWPASFVGQEKRLNGWFMDYYIFPFSRCGPYIVGVVTGALLARGCVRLTRGRSFVGWVLATAMGLACVYGLRGDISGHDPSPVWAAALYNCLGRSAWGVSLCWVIVACHLGYGGIINSILSLPALVPLSRLSYMAYLVHPQILYSYYGGLGSLMYVNTFSITMTYLGALCLVNLAALPLMLLLEALWVTLERALLK